MRLDSRARTMARSRRGISNLLAILSIKTGIPCGAGRPIGG
jgi:hypothetical protein